MANAVSKLNHGLAVMALLAFAMDATAKNPVASPDSATGTEDTVLNGNLFTNDFDPDGEPFVLWNNTSPVSGSLSIDPTSGKFAYTPSPNWSGEDGFTYSIRNTFPPCDSNPGNPGCNASATVRLIVQADADTPMVSASNVSESEDQPVALNLSAATLDSDGSETLVARIFTIPGGVSLSAGTDQGGGVWEVPIGSLPGLQLLPPTNANGTLTLTMSVTSTDRAFDNGGGLINVDGAVASAGFTVTVTPTNDAPFIAAAAPPLSTPEDTPASVSLAGVVDDPDLAWEGDTLLWSVSNISGSVLDSASMSGTTLNVTPSANAFGSAVVEVEVEDSGGERVRFDVNVDVTPVNDPPFVAAAVPDEVVNEDAGSSSVSFASAFDDVDIPTGDSLTLSVQAVSGDPVFDSVSMSGSTLNLAYAADQNGTAVVTVRATDQSNASVDLDLNVIVNAVNDAPVAGTPPSLTTPEDTPASVSMAGVFTDVDGDALTLDVIGVSGSVLASASMSGTTLNVVPLPDAFGAVVVTVEASDPSGETASVDVDVEVTSVNDAPFVVAAVPDEVVNEDAGGSSVSFAGAFDDVDIPTGDALTLSVAGVSGAAVFDSVTMSGTTLSLTYAADQNGTAVVTVRATDQANAFVDLDLNVIVNPVNDAPVAGTPPSLTTAEDTPASVSLAGVFTDVDTGDTLTLAVVSTTGSVLASAVMSGTTLDVVPVADAFGAATVTVEATDSAGAKATVDVDVTVDPVNDAPFVVAAVPDEVVNEDAGSSAISFAGVFDDADLATGDSLTLTVQSVSGAAVFDSVTISGDTLNLAYAADQNGTSTITVRATDIAGAWADQSVNVIVNPVNDDPILVTPIPDITVNEDGPDIVLDLLDYFDDVDIATNGDTLSFAVRSNSNASLFDLVNITGSTLTLSLAFDQNGDSRITIEASDNAGAWLRDTFDVFVLPVDDAPVPADDTVTINEDSGFILIDVLANDYHAEGPATITSAGVGGFSQGDPTTIVDPFGGEVTEPNGTVDIEFGQIRYEPKADFNGTDYFEYTIMDSEGTVCLLPDGTECKGRVTVNVTPVNDPPIGVQERSYAMFENGELVVVATDGVLKGAYDIDGAVVAPDGTSNPTGGLTVSLETSPLPSSGTDPGTLTFDPSTGAFTYVAPLDFVGEVTFTYRVFDNVAFSTEIYLVKITVIEIPDPPPPPPPGEVATPYNISNTPLEQTAAVPANVMIVMDTSGSMDWHLVTDGEDLDGGLRISNEDIANRSVRAESFVYLWDLPSNTYSPSSGFGRIAPTEEALDDEPRTKGNNYGVWRVRTHKYNSIYYNPEIMYTPWVGQDELNNDFGDADPENVRLNPVEVGDTIDLTALHSYTATSVPQWRVSGGTTNVAVDDVYLPFYYLTVAPEPLAWDAAKTLVEIRSGAGPLSGGLFPGSLSREDCRVGDNDPLTCTYEQELQNFANWFQYYRSREFVVKNSIGSVVSEVQDIRVGYETVDNTTSEPIRPMNDLYSEGNKKLFLDNVYEVDSFGGTPLRQMLGRTGKILGCEIGGDCPALPPPDGICQQNFALIFSDGYWNGGTGITGNPDDDGPGPFDGGRYADDVSATLADVAMHYYETDMFTGVEDGVPVGTRDILGAPDGTFADETDLMHQHMKTFAISFGASGSVEDDDIPVNPTTPFTWPDPFSGAFAKIDDLRHAALNGRGSYINASNPEELQAAFEAAFLEFTQAASSSSAAAFNSTSLRDGTLLYRGFYDLRDNTGELTATAVDVHGDLADTPTWRASEQLNPGNKAPDDRVIVTFDPFTWDGTPFRFADLTATQQVTLSSTAVDFIRGDRSNELPDGAARYRERPLVDGLLGDIVNSSPVYVGRPRAINRDQAPYPTTDLYSDYVEANKDRTPVLYVGANDGMMHGFLATTGEELFGYVPNKTIDSSKGYHNDLSDVISPFYLHQYFVDLTPRFNDAYVKPEKGVSTKSWNSILIGGLGGGGKGFFALNVNDPDTAFADEGNASDIVMWEFTDEDDTYPVDSAGTPLGGADGAITDPLGRPVKDLGYALSLPTLTMSNATDADGEKKWIALFGNGPNSTSGIAKLFGLFVDDGLDGWSAGDFLKLDTGFGVPIPPAQKAGYPNGLGTITAVDVDLNGTVDRAYGGDMLGNLFRFNLEDSDPDNWTVTRLFTASYNDGVTDVLQPIQARPLVVKHPEKPGFLIIFGTGSFFAKEDSGNTDVQSLYGIWDRGVSSPPTALAGSKTARLVEQVITNVVDDSVTPSVTRRIHSNNPVNYQVEGASPGTYGWYIDLDMPRATTTISGAANDDTSGLAPPDPQFPGEKAIRRMLFRNGSVITTTILPANSEASCFGVRPGSIVLFDVLDGGNATGALIDFNNDGVIDSGDLVTVDGVEYAGGLLFERGDLDGSLVDISQLGGEGDTDFLFVSGGNDTVSYLIEDVNDSRTGRLSWWELESD